MITEQEKLDFDSVPEYIRESRPSLRDSLRDVHSNKSYLLDDEDEPLAKSAELETLWPGLSTDFLHGAHNKKQPSFYWGIGFASGVSATVVFAAIVFGLMHLFAAATDPHGPAKIVLSQGKSAAQGKQAQVVVATRTANTYSDNPQVIAPLFCSYTVKDGDTLAGIALQAYKRATPRLLDAICRANGMKSAHVLSLGQTLTLPEYHPQSQIASGAASIQ
ncbi:MAG: LysM peptidoglycan-binding domain-containing protein [Candidatus Obscuribacterales bacterium]|nr:LysM peptidoglycan-binding domain-containing protein [Candidatus Obscuribacterales bacterium]